MLARVSPKKQTLPFVFISCVIRLVWVFHECLSFPKYIDNHHDNHSNHDSKRKGVNAVLTEKSEQLTAVDAVVLGAGGRVTVRQQAGHGEDLLAGILHRLHGAAAAG